ncbi:MAG: phenylalanine--tRNA ligase subunit alpha [Clostridia bacterium]|nr:phenylalanine--tRNA ligase subunit alpha [Clostridia bacterium]MBN2883276.1 phenylalanine--tRNA ligase subunit alpha [Clostridia bacterium]
MEQRLKEILEIAESELGGITDMKALEEMRVRFTGKKGMLTEVLRGMGQLSPEERPAMGKLVNEVRSEIEGLMTSVREKLEKEALSARLVKEKLDVTIPGKRPALGRKHPLTQAIEEMEEIFIGLGYDIAEGPEIETVYNNFDALNTEENHPSRDEQDTFYITDNTLLRTQTSPVQIRVMKSSEPPIKIICPGRVYRADTVDATHSPVFHQIEGLVIDKGVTMGDLIGTLKLFAKNLFGEETDIRLRPHHFPFTEPSAEVDVSCWVCGGKGCRVCGGEGWIEILGAGMVHPNVMKACGIDPEIYSGFAFGMGVERAAMGRHNISDLRLLFENDLRFLRQF